MRECVCIAVEHESKLFVTRDFIVTHNTLEMIVSAMEQKRLGLINKPMFVCVNHMLDQFANEFQSAYPAARILVADKDNFTGDARRRFVAKAALNDWDAIIIKQSSFGLIGIQQSTADSVADDILMELDAALDDTDEDDRVTRKKLEAQIDSVRQRVNALAGQGDKNITFEEMGVDFLYIDEAHQFRKLDFATNRQVKGIDPNGSKGAFGLFAKMRFLESKHAGRSAVLASGTPITNTIAELYTIQRYLDYTGLEEDGLVAFDAWANNYGAVAFEWERNAAAEFENVERFSKFVNVPELMMRVRKFMDVLTMEQLGDFVTRPAVKGGGPEMVTAQKSEALEKYMREDLLPRLQASKAWKPSKDEPFNPDPVIAIGTDGRLAAIDARFADKSLKDDPGSKLNLMIDDIIAEYKATNGNVYTTDGKPDRIDGGAQIVFSSVGFGDAVEQNRGFSPRKWMMKRLKDAGIPSSEVAFMGDYKTDKQKEAMFKDMREGRKRILVGSPANMGTGVNVQKRLTKLHFLAPPWYPADVEQPHGRILRQGNENKEVGLRWYLTEGTYDSTMWGMVRRKGRAIEQAFRGDGARTIEDISEVSSYAMAEAVSAGDDRVIKLAEAQATVEKYQRLKNAHFSEQRELRYDVSLNESRASWARKQILGLDESKRLQAEANFKYWEPLPVTIDNVTVNKAGDIGAKIGTQIAKVFADGSAGEHVIGKVLGTFDLVADLSPAAINNSEKDEVSLSLRVGPTELTIDDSCSLGLWAMKDEVGLGQKIKNAMVRVGERLNEAQRDLEDAESKLKKQRSRIGAPFSDDAALAQAIADAATIQAELVGESVKKQQDRANGAKAAAPAAKPNEAGKDDGETPSALRRSPDANAERIPFGVDAPTANTVVARLFSALGTSLPNTVVDSFHELPDEVQAEARAQGGDAKTTKGVFHRGTVYFVANNHDSIADLEETVLHEAIGHAGLRKLLGPEFVQKLNALFASLGGISGLSKIAAENGFGSIYDEYIRSVADAQAKDPAKYTDAIAKLILTEEVFAHIAQNRPTLMSKVKALIGWVRDWLRSHGFAKLAEYGETDVLNLLNRVKKNLRDPNGDGPKGGNFDAEAAPAVLRRSPMEAARDYVSSSEESIIGDTGRYTQGQMEFFRRVGRSVTKPSIKERIASLRKDFGKKLAQGLVDQFMPIKELSQKAYMLARLSKGAAGAFEALLKHGKLALRSDVYDADQSGGVIDRLLKPLQGEGDDFLWWVASNRAENLMNESAATRAEGARLLELADRLDEQSDEKTIQAKQLLQQAGNFPKSATGNQRAQKENERQAAALFKEAKEMRAQAVAARKEGNLKKDVERERLFDEEDIAQGKSLAEGDLSFNYIVQHDLADGTVAGTVTRDRAVMYADALKTLDEFNKNVMDMAEQSGLIDGESRVLWEHEFYVPFYRVSEEDGGAKGVNIKSSMVRQKAFERLKGGTEKLNSDLLANTLQNWAHLIDASAKNRAARETLKSAEQMGVAHKAAFGEKGSVWFAENGEHVEYVVDDPYVLTAISSLEYAGLRGPLMDAMSTFKHALTIGVTASPFFKVRNLIRDSIAAIGTAELGYNPLENIKEGYKATHRDSQIHVSMLAAGGTIHFGSMLENNEAERVRQLTAKGVDNSTILDNESKLKQLYDKFIAPAWDAYNEIGNRGEEINRAALYKRLTEQGMDHAEAAFLARDLMDFSMQGSWSSVRFLTQIVPFMNARMQGIYKLGRAAKDNPKRFGVVLGAVALSSIALMLAYKDDDDWKKREDWDRDNYWWFKLGGMAYRIPKPFEIGAIGSLAERGIEYFASDEMTGERFLNRFTALVKDNLSLNPIPQIAKPILDVYANKDSFSGRPIETMGMDRLKSDYRYTSGTSMAARAASTAGNAVTGLVGQEFLSPVQVDHMIRGYFGWLGTFVVGFADKIARPLSGEHDRPAPDFIKLATGGIASSLEGAPSRYVSQMYDQAKALEAAYATHRQLLKEGEKEKASEFAADHADELSRYHRVERIKAQETKYNQQIRAIELSAMPSAAKREMIDAIREKKHRIALSLR